MKKYLLTLLSVILFASASAFSQTLDYDKLAPHPRLLLKKGDITAMKEFCDRSANAKEVHNRIISTADGYLSAMPVTRKMTGRRLLSISREALKRIFYHIKSILCTFLNFFI